MERIPILHIPIDILSSEGVLRRCTELCRMAGQFHMMTPNPEMLVEASKNAEFKKVLQNSALNIPDGVGLVWALRRVMFSSSERVTASESRSAPSRRLLDSSPKADSLEEN